MRILGYMVILGASAAVIVCALCDRFVEAALWCIVGQLVLIEKHLEKIARK